MPLPPAGTEGRGENVSGAQDFWERVFIGALLKFADMGVKVPIPPARDFADEALRAWLKRWALGSWGPFLRQQKEWSTANATPAPPDTPPEANT